MSLVIPEEVATELGLRHRRAGRAPVTIEVGNFSTSVETIVGPAGSQVLIGQVVLEQLDLIADFTHRTLTPRHPEGPVLAIRALPLYVLD